MLSSFDGVAIPHEILWRFRLQIYPTNQGAHARACLALLLEGIQYGHRATQECLRSGWLRHCGMESGQQYDREPYVVMPEVPGRAAS